MFLSSASLSTLLVLNNLLSISYPAYVPDGTPIAYRRRVFHLSPEQPLWGNASLACSRQGYRVLDSPAIGRIAAADSKNFHRQLHSGQRRQTVLCQNATFSARSSCCSSKCLQREQRSFDPYVDWVAVALGLLDADQRSVVVMTNALFVGVAAGTAPYLLGVRFPGCKLHMVEPDPELFAIAGGCFGVPKFDALRGVRAVFQQQPAAEFIQQSGVTYSAAFVDVHFDQQSLPREMLATDWWEVVHGSLVDGGVLAVAIWASDTELAPSYAPHTGWKNSTCHKDLGSTIKSVFGNLKSFPAANASATPLFWFAKKCAGTNTDCSEAVVEDLLRLKGSPYMTRFPTSFKYGDEGGVLQDVEGKYPEGHIMEGGSLASCTPTANRL